MIESIEIENLRGIRKGKLEGLSPLTILVGPNGCGKSTVLDALYIGAHTLAGEAIERVVTRRKGVKEGARWLFGQAQDRAQAKLFVNRPSARDGRRTDLALELPNPGEMARISCQSYKSGVIRAYVGFLSSGQVKHDGEREFAKVVPDLRFIESYAYEAEPLHALYTRAVKQGRRSEAVVLLKDLIPELQNIEILTEDVDSPIIHLVYAHGSVPAALAGDGIHALLRLVLELAAIPGGAVLVEEPEIHQHPASLRQSARAIVAVVRRDVQIVLTTHSLELIDLLLAETQKADLDKLSLFRLKLKDNELIPVRVAGAEVARARQVIEDDLR